MQEREFVHTGVRITQLVVAALQFGSELEEFTAECEEQIVEHGDEPARYAFATAKAVKKFRDEMRELTSSDIASIVTVGAS